ncbi:MAG: hypothetical protein Q9227_005318 [Pyrenula ochraceoflavens]
MHSVLTPRFFALLALTTFTQHTLAGLLRRENAHQAAEFTDSWINPAKQALWASDTGPIYQDIAQGTTGDCWLDASLSSVAYADNGRLVYIVKDQDNSKGDTKISLCANGVPDTYTVQKRGIDDMNPSYSGAAPFVTGGSRHVWPMVMEDAFKAYVKKHPELKMNDKLDGGTPQSALNAMYGNDAKTQYIPLDGAKDDDLWTIINDAPHKPAITASKADGDKRNFDNGIIMNHAYSVFKGDKGKGVVTLRNPWGVVSANKDGVPNKGGAGLTDKGNGVFEISFDDWKKYYTDLTSVQCIAC